MFPSQDYLTYQRHVVFCHANFLDIFSAAIRQNKHHLQTCSIEQIQQTLEAQAADGWVITPTFCTDSEKTLYAARDMVFSFDLYRYRGEPRRLFTLDVPRHQAYVLSHNQAGQLIYLKASPALAKIISEVTTIPIDSRR